MWPWAIIARRDLDYYRERIAILEARVGDEQRAQRHCINMLLRRAGTFPIAEKTEPKPTQPQPMQPSGASLGMAQAIRDEGLRLNYSEADIDLALRERTGLSLAELKQYDLSH